MATSQRLDRRDRQRAVASALLCLAAGVAQPSRAAADDSLWFGAAFLAGSTLIDSRFSDFQWDVEPRASFGGEVQAGRGPWVSGLRLWRATSTQSIGQPGAESADVALTTTELFGQRQVAAFLGTDLLVTASVGGLWLGYRPDQVTFTPSGSTPIVVDLDPIHEWTAGGGLALRRPWAGPWSMSLAVDYQVFGLDTTHRNGNQIETHRESFGDWSARLGLGWSTRRP
jgi:hypothetical protein